jgi:hypothetical protein
LRATRDRRPYTELRGEGLNFNYTDGNEIGARNIAIAVCGDRDGELLILY